MRSEVKIIDLYDNVRQVHGGSELGDYLRENNIYKSIIDEIQKFPRKYGNYLNLSDIFMNEKESMFFTLVHLRDVGYQKVAEKITNFLWKENSLLSTRILNFLKIKNKIKKIENEIMNIFANIKLVLI